MLFFSSHWKVGSSMNCFFTEGWGGGWGCCCWGKIHIFAWHLAPVHRIQTKFGMDILLDPRNKPAEQFFIYWKIQDGRRPVKGPKSAKIDPLNHVLARNSDPAHPIWTKSGIDILLDPRNKPVEEFFIYRKIQDDRQWPPLQKITKSAITRKLFKLDT